jgi:hypothetical protein
VGGVDGAFLQGFAEGVEFGGPPLRRWTATIDGARGKCVLEQAAEAWGQRRHRQAARRRRHLGAGGVGAVGVAGFGDRALDVRRLAGAGEPPGKRMPPHAE